MQWSGRGANYGSREVEIEALSRLGAHEVIEDFSGDAADIGCLDVSTSPLDSISSLDDMATVRSPELVTEVSQAKLEENVAHEGCRGLFSGNDAVIDRFAWDGRLAWRNSDGSHHFAAARYIAGRLEKSLPIRATLNAYNLDADAVAELDREYRVFLVDERSARSGDLADAMRSFRATYLVADLPFPHEGLTAFFLPRDEFRARQVGKAMDETGQFDLGRFLRDQCRRQRGTSLVEGRGHAEG